MSVAGNLIINWRLNMFGPAWFRRLRAAWRWYRSGEPMITQADLRSILRRETGRE